MLVLFLIAVIPTLLGFLRSNHPGWIIHLTIVNSLIITLMFWGETRYRYSIEPVCIILAAQVLVFGLARLRGAGESRSPPIRAHTPSRTMQASRAVARDGARTGRAGESLSAWERGAS